MDEVMRLENKPDGPKKRRDFSEFGYRGPGWYFWDAIPYARGPYKTGQEAKQKMEKSKVASNMFAAVEDEKWKEPLLALQKDIHRIAVEKGWYDPPPSIEAAVLNFHGEASELSEALRNHNPESKKIPGFTCAEEEAADIIIRVLDTSAFKGWRVIDAMSAKIEYNKTRPRRHGGKAY